jgi:hypothetical protein
MIKAGPSEGPASRFSYQPVLETEVCATRERKRSQRANRHRDPLDQLHGTSFPAFRESYPIQTTWYFLAHRPPIGGHRRSLSGVPLMTHKPDLSPTAHAVVVGRVLALTPFHQIRWFPGRLQPFKM